MTAGLLLRFVPWSLVHAAIYRDSELRRTVESMLARVEDVPGSLLVDLDTAPTLAAREGGFCAKP